METGESYRKLIEYFLLMQNERSIDKLIYYDQNGQKFEREINRGSIDLALQKFDGKSKAVIRSSGGMVKATPHQLVMYEEPMLGENTPSVRIKVRFRDFKRDQKGRVTEESYVTSTKIVPAEGVVESFDYGLEGGQRFVMDFGQGAIPIYVFRYGADEYGRIVSLFVEIEELERMEMASPGKIMLVHPFRMERDAMRFARKPDGSGIDELDEARANYWRLKETGQTTVPSCLRLGTPIEVPTGLGRQEFRRLLAKEIKQHEPELIVHTKTFIKQEDLVPFGTFEK